jgi:hypothetical protein
MVTTLTDVNRSIPADFREVSRIGEGLITPPQRTHPGGRFPSSRSLSAARQARRAEYSDEAAENILEPEIPRFGIPGMALQDNYLR